MLKIIDDCIKNISEKNNLCISLCHQKIEQDFKKNRILNMERLYIVKSKTLEFELDFFYTGENKSFGYEFRFADFDINRIESSLFYRKNKTAIFENLTNGINAGNTNFGNKFDYMFNIKIKFIKTALNILETAMVNVINMAEQRFNEALLTELERTK